MVPYQKNNILLIENRRRFLNFFFETLKAYNYDCILGNTYSSDIEKFHASLELGKYLGKYFRREY